MDLVSEINYYYNYLESGASYLSSVGRTESGQSDVPISDVFLCASRRRRRVSSAVCRRVALHYAAGNMNAACTEHLLRAGAVVGVVDVKGCTPLHYAAASDIDTKWAVTPSTPRFFASRSLPVGNASFAPLLLIIKRVKNFRCFRIGADWMVNFRVCMDLILRCGINYYY